MKFAKQNVSHQNRSIAFFICIAVFAIVFNAATISAQMKKPFADSGEILAALTFTSSISKSKEQINKELIEAVQTRGVEFVLLEEDEVSLRNVGANDLLIKAIFDNLTAEFEKKFKESLYSKFHSHRSGDRLEIRKDQVNAAKMFLRLYGNSKEEKELVDYFREHLPVFEKEISDIEEKQKSNSLETPNTYKSKNIADQSDEKRLKLKEIIEKLNKNSGAEDEQKLVKEICERGADFVLNSESEKSLRDAGASDLLIKIIKDSSPEIQKEKERLYVLYVNNYDKNIEKRKIAVKAGKEYLEKFEDNECKNIEDQLIPYFKENIPVIARTIIEAEGGDPNPVPNPNPRHPDPNPKLYKRFNQSVADKNWDETFIVGAILLDNNTEFLDVALILATIGYDQAVEQKQNSKYDEKAIYYAEFAIKLIKEGKKSDTGNFGATFGKDRFYQYKTKDFPNGKENALGWMNYIIGYIKNFRQNKRDEAIPYFYKAAQYKSQVNTSPELYQAIGDWYLERAETSNATASKDDYLERAINAYVRAYNFATDFKFDKTKTNLFDKLEKLIVLHYGNETDVKGKIEEIILRTKNEFEN